MSAEREMIDRPKYHQGGSDLNTPLHREDLPCPPGTRIWLGLSQEEQHYTRWSPETQHWWLELPAERRVGSFRSEAGEATAPDPAQKSRPEGQ